MTKSQRNTCVDSISFIIHSSASSKDAKQRNDIHGQARRNKLYDDLEHSQYSTHTLPQLFKSCKDSMQAQNELMS